MAERALSAPCLAQSVTPAEWTDGQTDKWTLGAVSTQRQANTDADTGADRDLGHGRTERRRRGRREKKRKRQVSTTRTHTYNTFPCPKGRAKAKSPPIARSSKSTISKPQVRSSQKRNGSGEGLGFFPDAMVGICQNRASPAGCPSSLSPSGEGREAGAHAHARSRHEHVYKKRKQRGRVTGIQTDGERDTTGGIRLRPPVPGARCHRCPKACHLADGGRDEDIPSSSPPPSSA